MPRTELIVGVVGATGMVGRELVALLERRRFPVGELRPFSSGRAKSSVLFRGRRVNAPGVDAASLAACDIVFLVSSDEVSLELGPKLAKAGVWVIDDSAAFRMDPKVPLVIPEVNASALRKDRRLIAGPNCTMTGLAVAAAALHGAAKVKEARIASYQAVSGAGKAALNEFFGQATRRLSLHSDGRAPVLSEPKSKALPRAIATNVIPQVGRFDEHGHSGEERKVAAELRKVWNAPAMKVSVTAVRVPTIRGHALACWLTLAKPLSASKAMALMKRTPGLRLSTGADYPTPLSAAGREHVMAGRVRAGATSRELALWVVSDNLLKGAALNSVQVAEELLRRRWLGSRAAARG
jgi:aspartate-semialdehyde dehydrogenase